MNNFRVLYAFEDCTLYAFVFRTSSRYYMIEYCKFITFDISAHLIPNSLNVRKPSGYAVDDEASDEYIFFAARNATHVQCSSSFYMHFKTNIFIYEKQNKKNYFTRFVHAV